MAAVNDMMAAQTQAANAAAHAATGAGGTAIRCPDLTVTPEGMAPSAMRGE